MNVLVAPLRALRTTDRRAVHTVCGIFLAGFSIFGIGVYAFTQFLPALEASFGWDRAILGGTVSVFWAAAPLSVPVGVWLDRIGLKRLIFCGAACEAIAFASMPLITNASELYVLRFLMGVGKIVVATPVPITIARWFGERNAIALAIAFMGWHVGGLVCAPLASYLISAIGWHASAVVLSVLLMSMTGIGLTLITDPSRYSRVGISGSPVEVPIVAPGSEATPTGRVILFGTIGIGTIVFYAGYASSLSHLSPMLADRGFSETSIGAAMGAVAAFAIIGVLLGGIASFLMSSRASGAILLLAISGAEIAASILRPRTGNVPVFVIVVLFGLLIGAGDPIVIESLRRSVPCNVFGRVYGWWYLVCLGTLFLMPIVVGGFYDRFGNYSLAFGLLGALSLASAGLWSIVLRV